MKANLKGAKAKIEKKEDVVYLSIGMIVKNEERFLDRCLSAITDLLEKTNGELIIVDTGSTDNTVPIAKKYTDKVYFYEWTNDFAAARNETLKYATGRWYMFIDADEIFEQTDGIADFVLKDIPEKIGFAGYNLRNLTKRSGNVYTDAVLFRIYRNAPGIKFKHMVHENIEIRPGTSATTIENALCIHYGYSDDITKAQSRQKKKRNTELLEKCLDIDPDNFHYLIHYIREFKKGDSDLKRQLSYIDHAIEVAQHEYLKITVKGQKVKAYIRADDYLMAKEALLDQLNSRSSKDAIYYSDIDPCYLVASSAYKFKDYNFIKVAYEHYVNTINLFISNPTATPDIAISPQSYWSDYHQIQMKCYKAFSEYMQGDDSGMKNICKETDFSNLTVVFGGVAGVGCILDYCRYEKDYTVATELYRKFIGNKETLENYEKSLQILMLDEDEKEEIYNSFYKAFTGKETAFVGLIKAIRDNSNYKTLLTFDQEEYEPVMADIVYLMLKQKASYGEIIDNLIDASDVDKVINEMGIRYEDVGEIIPGYILSQPQPNTMAELRLYYLLCEITVKISLVSNKQLKEFFDRYCNAVYTEMINSFNSELYKEENFYLLPVRYRFVYIINQAMELMNSGDFIGAVKKLRESLKAQEDFVKSVEHWLEDIVEKSNQKEQDNNEFEELGNMLIKQAQTFILNDQKDNAALIINKLSDIMPDNQEVKKLKGLLGN